VRCAERARHEVTRILAQCLTVDASRGPEKPWELLLVASSHVNHGRPLPWRWLAWQQTGPRHLIPQTHTHSLSAHTRRHAHGTNNQPTRQRSPHATSRPTCGEACSAALVSRERAGVSVQRRPRAQCPRVPVDDVSSHPPICGLSRGHARAAACRRQPSCTAAQLPRMSDA
jgi:hypothetical protein